MKPKPFYLFFLFTFIFLLEATATVRYVSKAGSSTPPYISWATASDSIQKCINICQNGDTVYVANGIYKETLIVNKEIALIGSSMDSTVIDGRGLEDITINVDNILSMENIFIYGKGNGIGDAAIRVQNDIKISNCKISEAKIGIGSVSYSVYAENLIITDIVTGFSLLSAVSVVYNISDCLINLSNTHSGGISIGFAREATANIKNNIILFNHQFNNPGYGISLGWPKKVHIYNNLISGFEINIYIDLIADTAFIKNNIFLYKKFTTLESDGSISTQNDDAIIKNNIFTNNANNAVRGYLPLVSLDYNLFWENNNDLYGLNYGDSDRVANPMFIKDTIPSPQFNFDHHLQAFSPGIDKGDPNILDKDGTRSDIGMYGGPFGEIYTYKDMAPKAPRYFTALVDTSKITLMWNKNTEADTSYYKIYRDTVQNFTINSTNLIGTPTDSFLVQSIPPNGRYFYKVTCVDNQGNESNPSNEIVINITSINDYPITINGYYLYQNYPNPFNPSTKIGYQLKERGYVKLMVYDIKGELVTVLVNQEQEQGYYEVEFNINVGSPQSSVGKLDNIASGIYLYRIEVIGEGNIPVYMEMKKMLMIK